jgi:uncharacterized membrane protein
MDIPNSTDLRHLPTWRDIMLLAFGTVLIWAMLRTESRIDAIRQRVDAVAAQIAEVKDDVDDAAEDLDDVNQALDDIKDDLNDLGSAMLSGRQR